MQACYRGIPERTRDGAHSQPSALAALRRLHVVRRTTFVAEIAQLGERQTEDLKVPGSIPGLGTNDDL